jgi:3-hydroxyisobutyrate dehydrogenase-like beta-hydroxyacid dehydrogenase
MQSVGFIGLGNMGAPMAWNIHKAGYRLAVYNRTAERAQPFDDAAIAVAATPAALAGEVDVVVVMVTDPAALHAVIAGTDGVVNGLKPGATVINMSTVSPDASVEVASVVEEHGGRFVDAPVSGTVKPAEQGTLVVLAGGAREDVEAVTPLLETMGRQVVYCGGIGDATRMKLVLNLLLGGMMELLAEALALGKGFGLDGAAILKAVAAGPLGAPLYAMKGEAMLAGRFAKQFPVELMFKDLNLVLQAAGQLAVPLPVTAVSRESFNAARALGYGDEDMAAVIQVFDKLHG